MNTIFNVQDFLKTLENNKPQAINTQFKDRLLEKVYLNFPDNYGKYQIFPMNSTVTGFPFVQLPDTREVKIHRLIELKDGTQQDSEPWVKILPDDAYVMLDQTGRLVSSLTASEAQLLGTARALWDQLFDEMGGNQKTVDGSMNKAKEYLRKRQYTIFNAKCLNKWSLSDPRNPERQNFAGLFVCTAKGFGTAISDNIEDGKISHGGDIEWLNQIYNRDLDHRQGYLIFSIAMNQGGKIGYSVSATHESDKGQYLTGYGITPEEAELMQDPVETFLGWQAGHERPGCLFNARLIQETINYMSQELAAVRMAKSTGMNLDDAIRNTTATAMNAQQTVSTDPMIQAAAAQQASGMTNPQAVTNNNTTPFQNPPAAQIDPVSQTPVNPGFSQPAFAQGFGNNPFGK
jgi:hypothetical protein